MPSLYDIALTVTTIQVLLLLGHKWFTKEKVNKEMTDIEDYKERYTKTIVKAPDAFLGSIADWTSWKIGTRSIFGLMGLTQISDDREYVLSHPIKNTTVYHLLYQAVVKGTVSSTFQGRFLQMTVMRHESS